MYMLQDFRTCILILCIFSHLSWNNILCDEQHGFCHVESCETQPTLTINNFTESLNNNGQTDTILVEFSKAFNKISHQHLYCKLHHYGKHQEVINKVTQLT